MERGAGRSPHGSQTGLQEGPLLPLILENAGTGGDEASSEDGGMEKERTWSLATWLSQQP